MKVILTILLALTFVGCSNPASVEEPKEEDKEYIIDPDSLEWLPDRGCNEACGIFG